MTTTHPILVVDDDSAIQSFVGMSLRNEGYDVLIASDGQAALELVGQHQPLLILLDMRMPRMDGHAFIEAYHQTAEPRAPIIILTAGRHLTAAEDISHAAAVLAKPFNLDQLLSLVSRFTQAE